MHMLGASRHRGADVVYGVDMHQGTSIAGDGKGGCRGRHQCIDQRHHHHTGDTPPMHSLEERQTLGTSPHVIRKIQFTARSIQPQVLQRATL